MAGIPFGQGMNGLASYFAGQQAEGDQARQAADLATIMQAQERERQMLPLDVQTKQAQLPGLQGISEQQSVAGQLARQSMGDALAEKIGGYRSQLSEHDLKAMGATGDRFMKAAAAVKAAGIPPMMQPGAFRKIIAQFGNDEDTQGMLDMLDQVAPERQMEVADQMGQGMAKAATNYVQNTGQQAQAQQFQAGENKANRESHERIATGNNNTAIQVANINAGSRQAVAEARKNLTKPLSSEQRMVQLNSIPPEDRTMAENEELQTLAKQRLAERAASANGVPSAMLNLPTPQVAAQAASPFVTPPTPAPTGMVQVGTSGGRPVYGDAANPQDKSKWKY